MTFRPLCALAAIAFGWSAGGCTTPPSELRTTATPVAIEADSRPDVVYRRLTTKLRECYHSRVFDIASDYFADNRTATLSLSLRTPNFLFAWALAELAPRNDGTTITLYYSKGNQAFVHALRAWAHDLPAECPNV